MLKHHHSCPFSYLFSLARWILMPEGGFTIQARIFVLLDSNLYALLYVGYRIVGVLLARSRCCAGSCIARRHNAPHNGHSNVRYQCITATRILYKGHRRVDGSLSNIRLRCAAGICARQLCVTLRLVAKINLRHSLFWLKTVRFRISRRFMSALKKLIYKLDCYPHGFFCSPWCFTANNVNMPPWGFSFIFSYINIINVIVWIIAHKSIIFAFSLVGVFFVC